MPNPNTRPKPQRRIELVPRVVEMTQMQAETVNCTTEDSLIHEIETETPVLQAIEAIEAIAGSLELETLLDINRVEKQPVVIPRHHNVSESIASEGHVPLLSAHFD